MKSQAEDPPRDALINDFLKQPPLMLNAADDKGYETVNKCLTLLYRARQLCPLKFPFLSPCSNS